MIYNMMYDTICTILCVGLPYSETDQSQLGLTQDIITKS